MATFVFKLFISGGAARNHRAIQSLEQLCREKLPGSYELTVIDVLENAAAAEADRVLATPTLIKVHPLPAQRVLGDLSETERVLTGLGLPGSSGCSATPARLDAP